MITMTRDAKSLSLSRLINLAGGGGELSAEQWGRLIESGHAVYGGRLSDKGRKHYEACAAAERRVRISRKLRHARATRRYINSQKPYADD